MNKGDKGAGAPAAAKAEAGGKAAAGGGGYSMEEVAKHTTKGDCWVALNGQVLNVTNFLKDHPGGELAILTFAGKDASEEFNMIHPPDVVEKYAPDAVIGALGAGGGGEAPAASGGASAPLLEKKKPKAYESPGYKLRMQGEGKL